MLWDVIVVGAGIEGSSAAYNLAKAGKKTLQIEQFTLPHSRGSSHGHSRVTRKSYPEPFYCKMMVEGFESWKRLEEEEKVQLYIKTGIISVGKVGSKELTEIEDSLRLINSKFDRLDSNLLRQRFPTFNFDNSFSAVYESEGGMLLADKCLRAFQNQFKANGGVIRDGEPVLKIEPVSDTKVRVLTTKGEHLGKSVVIAAGPWTNKVLQPLGLQLPIKPLRVNVWYWKQLESGYNATDGFPVFICQVGHDEIYGLPSHEYPGLTKVCFHSGHEINDPDHRDANPGDDRYLRMTSHFVRNHLPGLDHKPSVTETCIYSATPDQNFILDTHPKWKNIAIGAGFSGHGFKFAPVVGKILAELATGKTPVHDLNPFKISRFAGLKSNI